MKNTYVDTMAEITRLQAEAERLRKSEAPGVIARIREAIDAYGFTASDLGLTGGATPTAVQAKVGKTRPVSSAFGIAKYRDPKSGKTWTGRGKPPTWIAGAKNREAFAIDAGAAASPRIAKTARSSKPAATVGVPKYRDPASGKTWTGRGKPPDWIAKAKDRAEFAIQTPASSDSTNTPESTAAN